MIQFESFADFIHMGGHGFYVWSAYAVTFVVFTALLLQPVFKRRKVLKAIKMRKQFEEQS